MDPERHERPVVIVVESGTGALMRGAYSLVTTLIAWALVLGVLGVIALLLFVLAFRT